MRFSYKRSRHRPEATGQATELSFLPEGHSVSTPAADVLFSGGDDEAIGSLESAIAALGPYLRERNIPSGQVINPLLDVWTLARRVNPGVARPVEELLTALISRTTTTSAELVTALDEVQIAALQIRVLSRS
jgi:hypothetical protein